MAEKTDQSERWNPYVEDLRLGGVTVAECASKEDAWFVVYLLERQGIPSAVSGPRHRDLHGPTVKVAPDDEEKARFVLTQPISQSEREAWERDIEFDPPVCPNCGATVSILQGVDEANHWRCDLCGIKWDQVPLLP